MIHLKPMSEAEFAKFIAVALPNYANEKMKGEGLTPEQAQKVAEESYGRLLPDGVRTPEQFLYSVFESATSQRIGTLWFARKQDAVKTSAFVYDIVLEPEARGRGYGKRLMVLLEEEARKLGITSIGLHVFGHNERAIRLYEKSGFRTTNRIMAKDLASI